MNIREFSFNLQKVYNEMAETFSAYQKSTGLACLSGCGKCCMNPDIEASVLEMVPLALKIYDENNVDEWMERLERPERDYCLLFISYGEGKGICSSYQERPSVCRMFGVAGTYDKYKRPALSVCKYIKEAYPVLAQPASDTPLIPLWFSKMSSLDPELTKKKIPINDAIKEALQKVALYAQYQSL
jgi:uncharacterized protein